MHIKDLSFPSKAIVAQQDLETRVCKNVLSRKLLLKAREG